MALFIFRSTDADAPVLAGTAGYLANLLQKCLVDGYNALTGVTVARSGVTATFNKTAHGFVSGQRVRHSGFTETEYNVDARVTRIDADNWSITVSGTPATPGATSGNAKMCPMDWTAAYTGTNKAAFQQPAGTNQFYLRVDDSNAQNAQVRGYETMSDVDTGTGLFPTTAQFALGAGLYVYKSNAASTAARAWVLVSNGKIFHLLTNAVSSAFPSTSSSGAVVTTFGDPVAADAADAYCTMIRAEASASVTSTTKTSVASATAAQTGCYSTRLSTGAGSAVQAATYSSAYPYSATASLGAKSVSYPDTAHGGALLGRLYWTQPTTYSFRAVVPGLWDWGHAPTELTHADTFSGAAGTLLAGKSFEFFYMSSSSAWSIVIETSDTWDTTYG